ncbi:MAG: hypothetical protein K0U13_06620 [Chlamydiae bacterium]|nr:hypothetical protein [Chlamydiota bacterium]
MDYIKCRNWFEYFFVKSALLAIQNQQPIGVWANRELRGRLVDLQELIDDAKDYLPSKAQDAENIKRVQNIFRERIGELSSRIKAPKIEIFSDWPSKEEWRKIAFLYLGVGSTIFLAWLYQQSTLDC